MTPTVTPSPSTPLSTLETLWEGDELRDALNAQIPAGMPARVTGVSIDTRTLQPGNLFFAIHGGARDGHDFVRDALAKGAAAAVVDAAHAPELAGAGPLYVVADVMAALTACGGAARTRTNARIVAVTGSVGKTSTKEALRLALAAQGAESTTHASVASYNNHWGVPLSLSRMPKRSRYGVFEIGMNAPEEIRPLSRLVRPHVAIITTVGPVHLEFFSSVEAIADAKGEIFSGLEPGGTAVINRDNAHFERLRQHATEAHASHIVTFGEHEDADIRAVNIVALPDLSVVEARVFGMDVVYRVGAPGRHIALNSLAVLAAVHALEGDLALAMLALGNLRPPEGRGERVRLNGPEGSFLLIDESYNANPASMQAALDMLGQTDVGLRGRRIAVLSDMLELGTDSPELHRELAPFVMRNSIDRVYAAGPLMHELWRTLPPELRGAYADTAQELEKHIPGALREGDVVMVKGSNGTRVSRIVTDLKQRFAELPARAAHHHAIADSTAG